MANNDRPLALHITERDARLAAIRAQLDGEHEMILARISIAEIELRELNRQLGSIKNMLHKVPGG